MQKKKGISLIVLVITIIVMIILAATIIISLNNNGIINKANQAVNETNLNQVQQLASLGWAEAYNNGVRTEGEFQTAVTSYLNESKVDLTKYVITTTDKGVTVKEKTVPYTNEEEYIAYAESLGYTVVSMEDYLPYETTFSRMAKIALPYGLTSIERGYVGCELSDGIGFYTKLSNEQILIPDTVTKIATFALGGSKVTSLIIPNSVTIPSSVTSIGRYYI